MVRTFYENNVTKTHPLDISTLLGQIAKGEVVTRETASYEYVTLSRPRFTGRSAMTDEREIVDAKKLTTQVASRAIDRFLTAFESVLRTGTALLKNNFRVGFNQLAQGQLEKISTIRNLLFDKESVDISELYVPLSFKQGSATFTEEDVIRKSKRALIVGTAGAGKTMFMRHAVIAALTKDVGNLPLLFELRNFNSREPFDLMLFMTEQIVGYVPGFMIEQLSEGLNDGLFALYLDAVDELDWKRFDELEKANLGTFYTISQSPNSINKQTHGSLICVGSL